MLYCITTLDRESTQGLHYIVALGGAHLFHVPPQYFKSHAHE